MSYSSSQTYSGLEVTILSKKRKYKDENRRFKTEWKEEIVFVGRNGINDDY
jgi:hypothetical protein